MVKKKMLLAGLNPTTILIVGAVGVGAFFLTRPLDERQQTVAQSLGGGIGATGDLFSGVGDLFGGVGDLFGGLLGGVGSAVGGVGSGVGSAGSGVGGGVKDVLDGLGGGIQSIIDGFANFADKSTSNVDDMINAFEKLVGTTSDEASDTINTVTNVPGNFLSNTGKGFKDFGTGLGSGIFNLFIPKQVQNFAGSLFGGNKKETGVASNDSRNGNQKVSFGESNLSTVLDLSPETSLPSNSGSSRVTAIKNTQGKTTGFDSGSQSVHNPPKKRNPLPQVFQPKPSPFDFLFGR